MISIMRGDHDSVTISRETKEGLAIPFEDGDILYFSVKNSLDSKTYLLQIIQTNFEPDGSAIFSFLPEHTNHLQAPKDYIYDVQLTDKDGIVTTLVWPEMFTLEGDVTRE